MFKTESEAWTAIADTLEMIEGLPYGQEGLCGVIKALYDDGFITYTMSLRMFDRIEACGLGRKRSLFLFPPRAWKPRAELARRLAEQTRTVQQEGV